MKKSILGILLLIAMFLALLVSCNESPENNEAGVFGIPCEINITASEGGSVQFCDYFGVSKHVYTGTEVTVIATANDSCVFIGWYMVANSEKLVSNTASYTFTAQGDLQLVAKFGKLQDVFISCGDGGSVSIDGSTETSVKILSGEELTIVATPDEYYTFDGWYNGEVRISTDMEYSFEVSSSVSLVAKFCEYPTVTVSASIGGDVSIDGSIETSVMILPGEELTVVATVNKKYNFIGWFVGDGEEPVSTNTTYTFTASESIALMAKFEVNYNGHEYVDLGLPSGLKWATCNVGANSPEEYGGYYAWGETEEKSNYDWSTYRWCGGSYKDMTKYCTNSSYGTVDNKTVLDSEDDVAHVKWGGGWRMPTSEEQDELRIYCIWTWTTQNGVKGYRVTGPNGNSIFLPAASCRYGTDLYAEDYNGYYWSSSLHSNVGYYAHSFYFFDYHFDWNLNIRHFGQSVRPVSE